MSMLLTDAACRRLFEYRRAKLAEAEAALTAFPISDGGEKAKRHKAMITTRSKKIAELRQLLADHPSPADDGGVPPCVIFDRDNQKRRAARESATAPIKPQPPGVSAGVDLTRSSATST